MIAFLKCYLCKASITDTEIKKRLCLQVYACINNDICDPFKKRLFDDNYFKFLYFYIFNKTILI